MSATLSGGNDLLGKLKAIVEENISNEQFGVSGLAEKAGMSRSNLLRKIKKLSGVSASQFIRQIRLGKSMELLKEASLNVSEISYQVGFGSTSYFIKCFREHYGFSPGEAGRRGAMEKEDRSLHNDSRPRQLAAIMFTDIEGYTALMQEDEERAVMFRERHREVFNRMINKFGGKVLQYYGDGTLSTFSSASNAVGCAIEMQQEYLKEPVIPVRIGIHSGDIIFTEDDIIGDGVNIAARIESLALSGSVFISDKIYDEIKNQSWIQTSSMGVFELKNVQKPMEVFAVTNDGLLAPDKKKFRAKLKSSASGDLRKNRKVKQQKGVGWLALILLALVATYFIFAGDILDYTKRMFLDSSAEQEKSIAVLPFINDSYDSTNVYIINGLMESILGNLQKISDLRVISRTSVEKYRKQPKLAQEVARELNARYLVEGSGQKVGNQVLLNIQLIEARNDEHLWAEQYRREVDDIFDLQNEIAQDIAEHIQVIITPEEKERINKVPTRDPVAYDYFLKGLDHMYRRTAEDLEIAINYYKKAVQFDTSFARAYANMAICYYYLDLALIEKPHLNEVNDYADKALQLDPQSSFSLVAKALYYMGAGKEQMSLPYLEKALEVNPNSAYIINTLSDYYARIEPDTRKYLEYALKGVELDIASHDSSTASFIYLHLSNALIQSGFKDLALRYINRSLAYDPNNLYSAYVKAYIVYANDNDLDNARRSLLKTYKKDTSRLDILQELAKINYFMGDYQTAYLYYDKFSRMKEQLGMQMYPAEDPKIAFVFREMDQADRADQLMEKFKVYADQSSSIYKDLNQMAYYLYMGDTSKAMQSLRQFSAQENYQFWILLFIDQDPLMEPLKDHPDYRKVLDSINEKFWKYHRDIRSSLEKEKLL